MKPLLSYTTRFLPDIFQYPVLIFSLDLVSTERFFSILINEDLFRIILRKSKITVSIIWQNGSYAFYNCEVWSLQEDDLDIFSKLQTFTNNIFSCFSKKSPRHDNTFVFRVLWMKVSSHRLLLLCKKHSAPAKHERKKNNKRNHCHEMPLILYPKKLLLNNSA